MRLESPAFRDGEPIPAAHSRDGGDASPPLSWTDPPAGTRSFALVCDDPDAPRGTWVHWVLWGIPASARSLAAGEGSAEEPPAGGVHGTLGAGETPAAPLTRGGFPHPAVRIEAKKIAWITFFEYDIILNT